MILVKDLSQPAPDLARSHEIRIEYLAYDWPLPWNVLCTCGSLSSATCEDDAIAHAQHHMNIARPGAPLGIERR